LHNNLFFGKYIAMVCSVTLKRNQFFYFNFWTEKLMVETLFLNNYTLNGSHNSF